MNTCQGNSEISPQEPKGLSGVFRNSLPVIYRGNRGGERPTGFSQGSEKSSNMMLSPPSPQFLPLDLLGQETIETTSLNAPLYEGTWSSSAENGVGG